MTVVPEQRSATLVEELRADAGVRTVLVVDDHRTFADLLAESVTRADGLWCAGVAYDPADGVRLATELRPDVAVLDVRYGDDEDAGFTAAAQIVSQCPGTRVVLLTGHSDRDTIGRAADAGACALVPKEGSLDYLLDALRSVTREGLAVHPELLMQLVRATPALPDVGPSPFPPLSPREADVLSMLSRGRDARAIATELGISVNTCRGYVRSLLVKLNAHSQLEAVAVGRRFGLVEA